MNPGEWDTARFAIQMTDRGPVVITDPLQMHVCRLLANGPMRPKELAQEMALASSSLHFILDKMVESDVIVRRRAEPGKKMVTYSLCSETVFFGFDPSEDVPFAGDGCPVGDLMRKYLRSIGLDAAILETGYSEVVAEVMTRSIDHCSYEESVLHAKRIVERMTGYKANVFSVSPLTVIVEGDETLEDCLGMVLGLFASVVRRLSGVCRVAGEPERFGSDDRTMFRSVFSASEPPQNVHGPRFSGEVQRFAVVEKRGRTQVVVSDVQVEILAVVSEGPSTVTEIVERSGFPRSTVTSNISKMEEKGLLDSFEGESGYICYRSACHVVLMTFDGRKRYSDIGIIEEGDGFMDGYVRYAASRIESMGFDAVSMMESLGSYCRCEELMEAGKECSRFGISMEVLSMDPVRVRLSGKKEDPARAIVKGMVRRKVSSMNDRAMMVEDEDGILTFEDMGVKQDQGPATARHGHRVPGERPLKTPGMRQHMVASFLRTEEYKLVVVVRNDLKMGKGKIAAQVAHAAVECALYAEKKDKRTFDTWHSAGQAKVALKVDSLEELTRCMAEARSVGLHTSMITDAGRTQIEPGTVTCVGIGPALAGDIDRVTGTLRML